MSCGSLRSRFSKFKLVRCRALLLREAVVTGLCTVPGIKTWPPRHRPQRSQLPAALWEAYHSLVAADVPAPDWRLAATDSAHDEHAAPRPPAARSPASVRVCVSE